MNEEIDPFDQRKDESYSEYRIRIDKLRKEYIERFKQQFREDPKIQEYVKQFRPFSVDSFLDTYAEMKVTAYQYAKFNERRNEQEDLQWINLAERQLANIQQKKLFNAQCLWRAEKLDIPEIEIAYDFKVWEHFVLDCPFIEPITKEDVELYQQFLEQENMQLELNFLDCWQDYESYKDGGNSYMPEWYEYYDIYRGSSSFINLPDIRGEKESIYIKESNKEQIRKSQEFAKLQPIDNRPLMRLYHNKDYLKDFVNRFEDKLTQRYFKADFRYRENNENDEEIINQIKVLIKADMPLKFEIADDWQTSLSKTVEKYNKIKVIEFLPLAFEQHKLSALTGRKSEVKKIYKDPKSLRNVFLNMILDGRELLGEPRNLEF
jgi:methyl coenzyme M reductase subunit D